MIDEGLEPQDEMEEILEDGNETVEEVEEEALETEDEESEEEEVAEGEPAPKKKKTLDERLKTIKSATWEKKEAERKMQATEQRINDANRNLDEKIAKLEARENAATLEESRPLSENYDTHEEYVDATMDWKIKKATTPVTKAPEQQTQAPQPSYNPEWDDKRNEALDNHEDFKQNEDNLVADLMDHPKRSGTQEEYNKRIAFSNEISNIITNSERSIELVQHLGKNRATTRKLGRLSPVQAAMEIGRLEERLARKSVKKITKAPRSVTGQRGGGGAPSSSSNDTESWIEERNKAEKAKRG